MDGSRSAISIIIVYLILVIIGMPFNPDTRLPLVVGATFMVIVVARYFAFGIGKRQRVDGGDDR